MSSTSPVHSLGFGLHAARSRWGWFVALGASFLILGGIACSDLAAATLASVFVIGAMMTVSGILQVGHAFRLRPLSHALLWGLSGLLYGIGGVVALADPLLASVVFSALLGIMLLVSGGARIAAGAAARPAAGSGWVVTGGIVTCITGGLVVFAWPGVGLILLGAVLAVDLMIQGWTFLAFGIALRTRA